MKKLYLCLKNKRALLTSVALVFVLTLCVVPQSVLLAEEESDLEDAISDDAAESPKAASSDDSLQDLEKVIDDSGDGAEELTVKEDAPASKAEPEEELTEESLEGESLEPARKLSKDDQLEEEPSSLEEADAEEERSLDEQTPKTAATDDDAEELEKSIADETPPATAKVAPPPPIKALPPPPPPPKLAAPEKKFRPSAGTRNEVTNLEFKMDGPKSRVVVSFRDTPMYREERNENIKQVVYYFENTETANRLQRAYDTSEFQSPVNIFTLLQMPGGDRPLSKLIVQLRENKSPQVTATSNALYIDFPPPDKRYEPKVVIGGEDNNGSEESIYASGKTFTGKRIQRLEVKNSDVQDVVRLIAKTSGYNVVVGDDVNGKVGTLSLENIPWDQAFALVLQSKKLGYIRQGNVIRVATLETLKAEKEATLQNEQLRIKVEPLKTMLIPVSYAKAQDISPRAKNFLTERGTIDVDIRTNTVIVKDIDKTITRVQKLIQALDTQPPRVSVSARIVEMLSSFQRQIGFDSHRINGTLAGVNLLQTNSFSKEGSAAWATTISAPNLANLTSMFSMAESENKVKTLAAPSLTVVANQSASVTQSNSFFVTSTELATGGVPLPVVKQFTASLNLTVTPIVAGDGSIFMTLSVRNEIPRGEGTDRVVDSRSLETQVMLENGDTAVIGGVFNNSNNITKAGVPFFSKLPVLGVLFSRNTEEDLRNEIFIFLTAKILNPEESFKRNF